jgi:hypothetical protein
METNKRKNEERKKEREEKRRERERENGLLPEIRFFFIFFFCDDWTLTALC